MQPLVSLLIPGWNGVKFVHRLLDSILEQTYSNIELIYVDDGSTDGTASIVLGYENKFLQKKYSFTYIRKNNGGVSSSINCGLQKVTGKYLCCPEYDDILTKNSIEERVKYLEEHPDCGVVTCDAYLVNENDLNHTIGVLSYYNPNRFDRNHFVQALMTKTIFTAACNMLRMSYFDETHPNRLIYDSRIGPNWQMLLPLYYKYNRGFIETPMVYYVIRKDSISHSSSNTWRKHLNSISEYKKIIFSTLETIEMPLSDRKLCIKIVNIKYALDYVNIGINNGQKKIFNDGMDELILNDYEHISRAYIKAMNNDLIFFYLRFKNFLRTMAKKIFRRL